MRRAGTWGWIGLTAYVTLWDSFANETLSGAFKRAVLHPRARWPVIAAWGVTTAHLFKVLPPRADPIARLGHIVQPVLNPKHKQCTQAP